MGATEQDRMIEAITTAVELETEARECYLAASRDSRNEAGRKLLQSLAEEEDDHRRRFQALYKSISEGHNWPAVPLRPASPHHIRQNLRSICQEIGIKVTGTAGELEMVNVAIAKEKNSYDFYRDRAHQAAFKLEREFYDTLADEEWQHALALQDYAEYLTDPAAYFVETEHPSLDGG